MTYLQCTVDYSDSDVSTNTV